MLTDLKHSHQIKVPEMMDLLTHLIVVIISQCVRVSNHCVVHFKHVSFLCQVRLQAGVEEA